MTHYPLLFGGRELVEGDGFVSRVAVSGRALLTEEDGEFWVEGVNPGGFAASGKSPGEALAEFSVAFRAILFDIASDARNLQDFQAEVQRFFDETNVPALRNWEEGVRKVRAGQLDAEWLERRPADTRIGVEVAEVSRPAATNNELGDAALAA
jgi:predicted RNase H-like HicB family nuclease